MKFRELVERMLRLYPEQEEEPAEQPEQKKKKAGRPKKIKIKKPE